DRRHAANILLDQNLGREAADYDAWLPIACARLIGPKYALLQPQYAELHPRTPPRLGPAKRILAYFGGADNHNLAGLAIAAFVRLDRPDIELDIVTNPAAPHYETLKAHANGSSNIHLHENLPSLAPLMLKADLA